MGIETALVASAVAAAGSTAYGAYSSNKASKDAVSAANAAELANATVEASAAPSVTSAAQDETVEGNAATAKKRRYSISQTVNNSGALGTSSKLGG